MNKPMQVHLSPLVKRAVAYNENTGKAGLKLSMLGERFYFTGEVRKMRFFPEFKTTNDEKLYNSYVRMAENKVDSPHR